MTTHTDLDDSLRWINVVRQEARQTQVEKKKSLSKILKPDRTPTSRLEKLRCPWENPVGCHCDSLPLGEAISSSTRPRFVGDIVALHFKYDQARRRFFEWAQNEIAVVPDFHKRILFSDEAHFWLNGYVNKQNCRIWSEANPQVYVETPLHPEKLTVWGALWAGGILLRKR
ncbi:hypothetical protein TNCV_2616181 [Trichonephila clavipes]|nr:hypothetical protein TNCV_2616181 [Trichonephila clavipes]